MPVRPTLLVNRPGLCPPRTAMPRSRGEGPAEGHSRTHAPGPHTTDNDRGHAEGHAKGHAKTLRDTLRDTLRGTPRGTLRGTHVYPLCVPCVTLGGSACVPLVCPLLPTIRKS